MTTYFLTFEFVSDNLSRNGYNKLPLLARNNPEERSSQNVGNFFISLAADELLQDNTFNWNYLLIIVHKSNEKST